VEAAALAAAEKIASQEPGLASLLAARALAVGGQTQQAAGLIKVHELSAEQIKALSARLNAEGVERPQGDIRLQRVSLTQGFTLYPTPARCLAAIAVL
jgi:hypothetical protein